MQITALCAAIHGCKVGPLQRRTTRCNECSPSEKMPTVSSSLKCSGKANLRRTQLGRFVWARHVVCGACAEGPRCSRRERARARVGACDFGNAAHKADVWVINSLRFGRITSYIVPKDCCQTRTCSGWEGRGGRVGSCLFDTLANTHHVPAHAKNALTHIRKQILQGDACCVSKCWCRTESGRIQTRLVSCRK